jgi:NADPH2:quinone reductase
MKAIEINPAGMLAACERPVPVPAPNEVLIKVAAAGMNRADLLQLKGLHPPPPGASDLPGLEVSGHIEAVGAGVSEAMIGEKVCALIEGGGYAEYATAKVTQCLPIIDKTDLIHAAGLPEALFTVTKNVFMIGQLRADDHLLIHGGASGIGTLAIQMAKSVGAFVTATAGTDEKCNLCRELGADLALNYKDTDFAEALTGNGVDVVFDMAGGTTLTRTLPLMNKYGRYINIAYMENVKAEIDISIIMRKQLTLTGSTLRHDIPEIKESYAEMIREIFWPEVTNGTIKPVIHTTYPLADAILAHQAFASGNHAGKILLIP